MLRFMTDRVDNERVEIQAVPSERWRDVLTQIVVAADPIDGDTTVKEVMRGFHSGEISPSGLLEAVPGSLPGPVAAVFGYASPSGRMAIVYPPYIQTTVQTTPSQPARVQPLQIPSATLLEWGEQLCQRLESLLRKADCQIAQMVVVTRDPQQEKFLARLGYRYLAELVYMYGTTAVVCKSVPRDPSNKSHSMESPAAESASSESPAMTNARAELQFVASSERSEEALQRLVESTYSGSLDCPAIDGLRTTADVLDGYRRTGRFSPDNWFFVEHLGQAVGCLLLTEHAEHQWELIYMGLVPTARGRRWGESIARFARWVASERGASQMVLAVDARNEPACMMYRRAGFSDWAHRHVYFKPLSESAVSR